MEQTAMDVANQADAENTENTENSGDVSAESQPLETQDEGQLAQLSEMIAHYKSEVDKFKEEAKSAFKTRDKMREQLRNSEKQKVAAGDTAVHISSLEEQLDTAQKEIKRINTAADKAVKMDAIRQIATDAGCKENYLDKLDRFMDMSAIDADKSITIDYQVSIMKTNYPDLFGASGPELNEALPAPNLKSGDSLEHFKRELAREKQKGLGADLDKLFKLEKVINDA